MTQQAPPPPLDVAALRARFEADRASAGGLRPLSDYLALGLGDPEGVARGYLAFKATADASAADSGERRIGAYRVLKELGRGGQGTVVLAEDDRLRRKVAVKILTEASLASPAQLERFRREAEIASKLDHQSICGVYDVGTADGLPYIAMRYVEGETLASVVARLSRLAAFGDEPSSVDLSTRAAPLAAAVAAPAPASRGRPGALADSVTRAEFDGLLLVVERCARALHVAHEAGIVHRDIKPGNIMVAPDGTPVIFDFGLARDETAHDATLTQTGFVMGTPAYLAPEQLSAKRAKLDRRCDVYALGVTLYECATFRRPFEAPTQLGLFQAILTKTPEDPRRLSKRVSDDLRVVIETALEKDRDRRYQTAEALAEDLRRVRENLPILARPVSSVGRVVRWSRRNPAVASAMCAVFLALSVGLAATLVQKARADRNAADAAVAADESRRQAARAEASLLEWNRLADRRRLDDLVRAADGPLWPATPEKVPAMEAWLADAAALLARAPRHREALVELRRRATAAPASRPAADSAPTTRPAADAYAFAEAEDQFRHDNLAELVVALERFGAEAAAGSNVAGMRARLEDARTLRARTLDAHADAWRETVDAVALDPAYGGLRLKPQLGLVPLGRDPASKRFEFADVRTGRVPTRGKDGRLDFDGDCGMVFVLLPGGSFRLGAQSKEPDAPHYDASARSEEGPVRTVTLSAFFASKYETTQGQWLRATGVNPSQYAAGGSTGGRPRTLAQPVEQTSFDDAVEVLRRLGCALPTEAQWEYAARAGSDSPWSCGGDAEKLADKANLADQYCRRNGGLLTWTYEEWDDGYVVHAPVGSFAPNGFGLHDVHGNVFEWCRDAWGRYDDRPRAPGDGLRLAPDSDQRVIRGGGYAVRAVQARSSFRSFATASSRTSNIGVRAVRAIADDA